jgi:hypothetical protein
VSSSGGVDRHGYRLLGIRSSSESRTSGSNLRKGGEQYNLGVGPMNCDDYSLYFRTSAFVRAHQALGAIQKHRWLLRGVALARASR